jgi:hypothetical protein
MLSEHAGLDVHLVSYGSPHPVFEQLQRSWVAGM